MKDEYLRRTRSVHDESAMLLLSLLPALGMLQKLLYRKEHGKRPFSEGFAYARREEEIRNLRQSLLQGRESPSELLSVVSTCETALAEIRTKSLRDDVLWLKNSFECALLAIEEEKEKDR